MTKKTSADIIDIVILAKLNDGKVRQLFIPRLINNDILFLCASTTGRLEMSDKPLEGFDIVMPSKDIKENE